MNKSSSNLSADELLELLNTDKTFQDTAQSGVVTDKVCVSANCKLLHKYSLSFLLSVALPAALLQASAKAVMKFYRMYVGQFSCLCAPCLCFNVTLLRC